MSAVTTTVQCKRSVQRTLPLYTSPLLMSLQTTGHFRICNVHLHSKRLTMHALSYYSRQITRRGACQSLRGEECHQYNVGDRRSYGQGALRCLFDLVTFFTTFHCLQDPPVVRTGCTYEFMSEVINCESGYQPYYVSVRSVLFLYASLHLLLSASHTL